MNTQFALNDQSEDMPMKDSGSNDDVGYRKPPVRTQFVKGKSGNPKGRRRKPKGLYELLEARLEQKVTLGDGGKKRRITAGEAIVLRLVSSALKGDFNAIFKIMALTSRARMGSERKHQRASAPKDVTMEDVIRFLTSEPDREKMFEKMTDDDLNAAMKKLEKVTEDARGEGPTRRELDDQT